MHSDRHQLIGISFTLGLLFSTGGCSSGQIGGTGSAGGSGGAAGSVHQGSAGAGGTSAAAGNGGRGGSAGSGVAGAGGGATGTGGSNVTDAGFDSGPSPADGPGVFVAVGAGGRRIRSLDDGATWVDDMSLVANGGDDTTLLRTVAWGNHQFVAIGYRVGKCCSRTPSCTPLDGIASQICK